MSNNCPQLRKAQTLIGNSQQRRKQKDAKHVKVVDALSARVEIKREKDHQILLDNQCQIHIFAHDHLLSNINHQTDHLMTVCGEVDGSNFTTDLVGNFLDFEDDVYISPSAKANLLSFSLVFKL
jgi:hypothetical protein